jgi:hypothetical protein
MAYNSVTKEPTEVVITSGNSSPRNYHLFPALKQNVGGHGFEDDGEE